MAARVLHVGEHSWKTQTEACQISGERGDGGDGRREAVAETKMAETKMATTATPPSSRWRKRLETKHPKTCASLIGGGAYVSN